MYNIPRHAKITLLIIIILMVKNDEESLYGYGISNDGIGSHLNSGCCK
ncbi:hypothetical protein AN2351V1_3382 [Citrobacter koseri]|nr:hypothetical protein AN2351V1_3382 [Citrobacter koseri]CAH6136933.1 hypothetical protein AN2351V1_3382 [Citrobacter koseri]